MKKIILLILTLSLASMACYSGSLTATAPINSPTPAAPIKSAPVVYEPIPTITPSPACIVTAGKLNIRKAPNADVIAYLFSGEIVTVLDTRGAWSQIRAGKVTGWINSNYCEGK